jgi:predicted PurR-regulated permease PerM
MRAMFANRSIQLTFFFSIFGAALILGFFIFRPYLNTLVMAATFAIIFYPLYKRLDARFKHRWPSIASILTVTIASLIIFVPTAFLGTRIYTEGKLVYEDLSAANRGEREPLPAAEPGTSQFVLNMREKLNGVLTQVATNLDETVQESFGWLLSNVPNLGRRLGQVGIRFFIWFLAFYYMLRDGHRMRRIFVALSPLSDRYDNEIADRISTAIKSVIGGSLIVAISQGIATGIGLLIFGVPAPAVWGGLAVLAALVPNIGTALVILPAAAYLFLIGKTAATIGLLIWGLTIVNIIDNFLRPKLIERGTRIHPLLVLLSVLGGITLLGPVGFLIGPIIMSLILEFLEIYNEMILHHRNAALPRDNISQ